MNKLSLQMGLLICLAICASVAKAGPGYPLAKGGYNKLEIHYSFGYKSPTLISVDRARAIGQTEIVSTDSTYILHFIKWLALDSMTPQSQPNLEKTGAFIVIDLYRRDDGKVETFYSDGDYLYAINPAMKKQIDATFRTKFYFAGPGEGDIIDASTP